MEKVPGNSQVEIEGNRSGSVLYALVSEYRYPLAQRADRLRRSRKHISPRAPSSDGPHSGWGMEAHGYSNTPARAFRGCLCRASVWVCPRCKRPSSNRTGGPPPQACLPAAPRTRVLLLPSLLAQLLSYMRGPPNSGLPWCRSFLKSACGAWLSRGARRKVRVPGVSGVLEFTAARRGLAPWGWLLGSPARGPERARPVPLTFVCFCFCGWKTEMLFS